MNTVSPINRSLWWEKIFLSSNEPRLRAGWRLLVQVIVQFTFTFLFSLLIFLPYRLVFGTTSPTGVQDLALSEIVEFLAVTLSIYLAYRFLDKRGFTSLGLRINKSMSFDILTGIGISLVMMGMIFLSERLLGWLSIKGFAWSEEPVQNVIAQAGIFFIVFIVIGWNEELMSRGYHLQTLSSGINLLWGLIISSAIFGALHLANPHATWTSTLGIFLAGLFLGYAFIQTKQLWLSIGLHIGWNFFEGVIFGFPVSGLEIYHITHIKVSGPALWTGGSFGPEAGLILAPALAAGGVLIHFYSRSSRLS